MNLLDCNYDVLGVVPQTAGDDRAAPNLKSVLVENTDHVARDSGLYCDASRIILKESLCTCLR